MLTIFCPKDATGVWQTSAVVNGSNKQIEYRPRLWNGWNVLNVPRMFFATVILPSNNGKLWQDANWEIMNWLGEHPDACDSDAFPGEGRSAPVPVITTEVAPVMVRLRAPVGVTSYSHGGVEHKIAKDGHVTVDEHVAAVLQSHSFVRA